MAGARVSRINVTPVKSLRLQHPDVVELGPDGARGGPPLPARRRRPAALQRQARHDARARVREPGIPASRVLAVTLPGGEVVEVEVARRRADGRRRLRPARPRARRRTGRGPMRSPTSPAARSTLVERDDGAWATDSRPATLVSQRVARADRRRRPPVPDAARARRARALGEEAWRGRRVRRRRGAAARRRADASLRRSRRRARTRASRDRDVLRELIEQRGAVDGEACLGVYAEVLEPGASASATRSSSRSPLASFSRAPADPDLVLAAVPGPPVEPAVERLDVEPGSSISAFHSGGESQWRSIVAAWSRLAHGEDERRARARPSRRARRSRLALEPQAVGLLDVRAGSARRRRTRDGRRARAARPRRSSARSFSRLVGHVEQRAERDRDEGHALVDRRLAQVADAQVEQRPRRPRARRTRARRRASPATRRRRSRRSRPARSGRRSVPFRRPARRPARPTPAPRRRRTRRPR